MNPSISSRSRTPTDGGAKRLRLTFKLACWWLAAQGLLYLLLDDRIAGWFRLRYQLTMQPYLRQAAICYLALALLLGRGVSDPKRQALTVDVLVLVLVGQVFFNLSYRLNVDTLVPFEWLALLVNAALAGFLILDRTRSSQIEDSSSLVGAPAWQWIKKLGARARGTDKTPIDLGSLGPVDEAPAAPAPIPTAPPSAAAPAPAAKSKALPHMD